MGFLGLLGGFVGVEWCLEDPEDVAWRHIGWWALMLAAYLLFSLGSIISDELGGLYTFIPVTKKARIDHEYHLGTGVLLLYIGLVWPVMRAVPEGIAVALSLVGLVAGGIFLGSVFMWARDRGRKHLFIASGILSLLSLGSIYYAWPGKGRWGLLLSGVIITSFGVWLTRYHYDEEVALFNLCTSFLVEDAIQNLLAGGVDVNARDEHGRTPLMRAASLGRVEVVRVLLDAGADINSMDNEGWTALMYASARGFTEIVQLIENTRAKEEPS